MKDKKSLFLICFFSFFICFVRLFAEESSPSRDSLQEMQNMMKNILIDNQLFRKDPRYTDEFFSQAASGQNPRTTVVACADSRVHTSNFDFHPLGDIFFIRNIGNQIEPCLGSIDYGVLHLKTSLLLFLGHSKCGAVTAVTKGTDDLEESIRKELEPMHLSNKTPHPTDEQIAQNVAENVQHQVTKAYERYRSHIDEEKLWIVGAVYDFTPQAHGELKIIQVNDRTDQDFIRTFIEEVNRKGNYYDDPGRVPSEQNPSQTKKK